MEKYQDRTFFSEINEKSDVLCFRDTAEMLIIDKWYQNKKANCDEKARRI